ncbi:MAG: MarR family transcriptional regulator [Pigmentiphaga sp.]|nr:MarR family transcriptional regulator [Pigmentiphaga sp.]
MSRSTAKIVGSTPSEAPEQDEPLALGILPTLVGRQLRLAQLMAFKGFVVKVEGVSFSPGSFEVLELLSQNPGVGQNRLATAIGLDKSTLVPIIARLESLELVERRPSEADKRAYELRITPKGRRQLIALREYVLEREAGITAGMTSGEIQTLRALLDKVVQISL